MTLLLLRSDNKHLFVFVLNTVDNDESIDSSSFIVFEGLAEAKKEIEALKQAMRDMAEISARALSGKSNP